MNTQTALQHITTSQAFREIDGVSIRFVESEPRNVSALLLSPWPESVFAYEPTWPRLAEQAHLVAIDLPGFGRSEYREALMSPQAMAEFIVRVADVFGLEKPHVVAPDVGTSASLFAAGRHPGRFRSVVVGSGGAKVPLDLEGELRDWIVAPDLEPYRKTDGRQIVEAVLSNVAPYELSAAAREDYLSSYSGERFANSMRYVRAYPTDLPVLADLLPRMQTPVQIISGRRDPVVPNANGDFLNERLPNSELHVLDAGHFTWEDAADEYATLVSKWWSRH